MKGQHININLPFRSRINDSSFEICTSRVSPCHLKHQTAQFQTQPIGSGHLSSWLVRNMQPGMVACSSRGIDCQENLQSSAIGRVCLNQGPPTLGTNVMINNGARILDNKPINPCINQSCYNTCCHRMPRHWTHSQPNRFATKLKAFDWMVLNTFQETRQGELP